jgi:hypothetical protein
MSYLHHRDFSVELTSSADAVFDYLDDQTRLGVHMEKPSMMMLGGSMRYDFDAARGMAKGSVIKMTGSFLGIRLFVEEVVVERRRPDFKMWETRGTPRLLIIGAYRMGFEIAGSGDICRLRVFIDYNPPLSRLARIMAWVLAPVYARWCVNRMAKDAERHFSSRSPNKGDDNDGL